MEITKRETALIDEWIALHREIEELEEFRDLIAGEIKKLDKKADKEKIKQLTNLKSIVEHDINIDKLVEQDIDIEEKGIDIDLKDYNKT